MPAAISLSLEAMLFQLVAGASAIGLPAQPENGGQFASILEGAVDEWNAPPTPTKKLIEEDIVQGAALPVLALPSTQPAAPAALLPSLPVFFISAENTSPEAEVSSVQAQFDLPVSVRQVWSSIAIKSGSDTSFVAMALPRAVATPKLPSVPPHVQQAVETPELPFVPRHVPQAVTRPELPSIPPQAPQAVAELAKPSIAVKAPQTTAELETPSAEKAVTELEPSLPAGKPAELTSEKQVATTPVKAPQLIAEPDTPHASIESTQATPDKESLMPTLVPPPQPIARAEPTTPPSASRTSPDAIPKLPVESIERSPATFVKHDGPAFTAKITERPQELPSVPLKAAPNPQPVQDAPQATAQKVAVPQPVRIVDAPQPGQFEEQGSEERPPEERIQVQQIAMRAIPEASEPQAVPRAATTPASRPVLSPVIAEPELVLKPQLPVRNIVIRQDNVDIRMVDRGGAIHVSVQTPDALLSRSLQSNLPDFVAQLDRKGLDAQTWQSPVSRDPSDTQNGKGRQDQPEWWERPHNQRPKPEVEEEEL